MTVHVFHGDLTPLILPEGHRFPTSKYAMLRARLLDDGVLEPGDLHEAAPAPVELVVAVHDRDYVEAFVAGRLPRKVMSRIGLPWSEGLVRRAFGSVGATVSAARAALDHGIAAALGGGTHHAFADGGGGYCVLNDLAVAARALLDTARVARVLVLDLDVHQGDGTAAIFARDDRVFTCSVHGERTYPVRKKRSDLDVPLADGTGDEAYLSAVHRALEESVERARPDIILYQAGVDVLAEDRLGTLSVSLGGLALRDRHVFDVARRRGIPVALTLGGGYARPIEVTVEAHLGTFVAAREVFGATDQ